MEIITDVFRDWLLSNNLERWHELNFGERNALVQHHTNTFVAMMESYLSQKDINLATIRKTPVQSPPFVLDDDE